MNTCIIKSKLNLSKYLGVSSTELDGFYYHHITLKGRDITKVISNTEELLSELAKYCYDSNFIDLWREKESQYNFEKPEDICYSEEYFEVKKQITKDVFQAVIFDNDLELFEVRADIIGTYQDFDKNKEFNLMFVTTYKDCIMCTSYYDVDYSSIENYIKTRNSFVL